MIDLKLLRASPGQVRAALARRGDPSLTRLLDEIEALDMKRRTLTAQLDTLKAERNDAAKADALVAKSQGGLPDATTAARRKLGERITGLESELRQIETTLEAKALFVPNLPLPDVPEEQTILRSWGTPGPKGGKPHWEIAERLGILDLPRGAKLAGSGFPVLMGAGARLARGLINFMLDLHTREHGYIEVEPPFLVRRDVITGTGQLPKFEDDLYRTMPDDLFLVPTAEVPVTNLHRDEILDGTTLPKGYAAYTPCFRREAGAAGKDTRGLLRVHQFDKVELVRFCLAADSPAEHEKLTLHAETGAAVSRRRIAGERLQLRGRQDLRSRGVGSGRRPVARSLELQHLHRLSGPPGQHSLPPAARREARIRAHIERVGCCAAPHDRGAARNPPAVRRLRHRPAGVGAVCRH